MNMLIFRLGGSGVATDKWDSLLSQNKLVWGFGNDDFHFWCDLGRSFNYICSQSNDYISVKKAIDCGSFYVSSGLTLDEFKFDGKTLKIRACTPRSYISTFQYRFLGKNGRILKENFGECAEYTVTDDDTYIRVEAYGEQGFTLFTQPIYKKGVFERP